MGPQRRGHRPERGDPAVTSRPAESKPGAPIDGAPAATLDAPGSTDQSQRRLVWVDIARGICIFLVVFGHTLTGLTSRHILESRVLVFVEQGMRTFRMPLFFFIAGLFAPRAIGSSLTALVINKARTILYPYVVWSVLWILIRPLSSDLKTESLPLTDTWRIAFVPMLQFWFLYALFVTFLGYALARRLGLSGVGFLLLSLVLSLSESLGISLGWGVADTVRHYAPYFALGAVAGSAGLADRVRKLSALHCAVAVIFGFTAVYAIIALRSTDGLSSTLPAGLAGITALVALAVLVARYRAALVFQEMGLVSLQIYVAHTIFAAAVRNVLGRSPWTVSGSLHLLLGTTAGVIGPMLLVSASRRWRFEWIFLLRPPPKSRQPLVQPSR